MSIRFYGAMGGREHLAPTLRFLAICCYPRAPRSPVLTEAPPDCAGLASDRSIEQSWLVLVIGIASASMRSI